MNSPSEVLTRGVYVAPWLDLATRRSAVILIDHRGCCIHQTSRHEDEAEAVAMTRAEALLELLDPLPM